MKRPFRYFRGEFNGKYLYDLVTCPNFAVQDILDELIYQILFQWKLEDEVVRNEMPIRDMDIYNIGKIAGLFPIRTAGLSNTGSIEFTKSHIVNGKERSERGLMDMEDEIFKFIRTNSDEYPDDIVSEASPAFRATYLPKGAKPVGYIPLGVPAYTPTGEVIWENILSEPPTDDTPYTTYYGEQFLFHEEFFDVISLLPIYIYKLLLECMQQLRYNGPSVDKFMRITQILGGGYITNIEMVRTAAYYTVYWEYDNSVEIPYRARRLAAWLFVCKQKFKLYKLKEREG